MDRSHRLRDWSLKFSATTAPFFLLVLNSNVPDLSKFIWPAGPQGTYQARPGSPCSFMDRMSRLEEDTEALSDDKSGSSTQEDPKARKCTGVGDLASQEPKKDGSPHRLLGQQ